MFLSKNFTIRSENFAIKAILEGREAHGIIQAQPSTNQLLLLLSFHPLMHTHAQPADHSTATTAATAQHTRSSTCTKTKSCHNNELSKHIHSVLL